MFDSFFITDLAFTSSRLQAMLPWVTTALTEDEQNIMMDTLRQATRNTMFDKWLRAWWKNDPASSSETIESSEKQSVPSVGTNESLQMVVDYLSEGAVNTEETTADEILSTAEASDHEIVTRSGKSCITGCSSLSSRGSLVSLLKLVTWH